MKIIRYVLIFSAHQGKAYLILYVYPHFTFKRISSFYRSRQHFDFVQWRYLTCLCQIWIRNGSQGWQIGQEFQFVWSAIQLSPQHSWDAKALLIRKTIFDFWIFSFPQKLLSYCFTLDYFEVDSTRTCVWFFFQCSVFYPVKKLGDDQNFLWILPRYDLFFD